MYTIPFPLQPSAPRQPRADFSFPFVPVAVSALAFLFIHSGPLLRWLDPTAAAVDIGAISIVLLALAAVASFIAVSRWLLGLLWPVLRDYQRYHLSNNFKSLQPWQKISFYLVIFFGLLYAFVCSLAAVS
ncbi:MAG: hypothetical protein EAS52_15695 [Parapedobacter sp.]|nr:MAG: hypothetical protein EAS52_15695 [Parapedobacter sp.]